MIKRGSRVSEQKVVHIGVQDHADVAFGDARATVVELVSALSATLRWAAMFRTSPMGMSMHLVVRSAS